MDGKMIRQCGGSWAYCYGNCWQCVYVTVTRNASPAASGNPFVAYVTVSNVGGNAEYSQNEKGETDGISE